MQTRKILLISAAVLAAMTLGSAGAKDGTYKSTTVGRNGPVTVETVIRGDRIASVRVLDWNETHPIADLPREKVPADIVKYQTTNVDNISGATFTSFAIRNAVNESLREAGLDPAKFAKKAPAQPKLTGTVTEKADIVIVGGGGAGMSAALAAAEAGRSVIVIEKTHALGGNTSVSGGCFNAADPKLQAPIKMTDGQKDKVRKLLETKPRSDFHAKLLGLVKEQWKAYEASGKTGIFDSPELHALQTWEAGDYVADLALVYNLAQNAPKAVEKLASLGVKWPERVVQYRGALWPRSHIATNFKSGVGFIDTYLKEIKDKRYPVRYFLNTKASDLIVKNGRVTGVKAKAADGRSYVFNAARGVVMATGGFSANVQMRMKYDQLWEGRLNEKFNTTNLKSITGDGIVMAQKAGAALVDMGLIQMASSTDPNTGSTNHRISDSTGIFVNQQGNRFVNEFSRRDVLARNLLKQPNGRYYLISSEKNNLIDADGRNPYGVRLDALMMMGKVVKADTLEELAKKVGMNPDNLKRTVDKWNAFCKTQTGDEFGRNSCTAQQTIPSGPYYATAMAPAAHHTMGGVKVDTRNRVIGTNGKPIAGLYAAGEVTGGIHGTNRVGCNAVPDALANGRFAGIHAAEGK